MASRSNARLGAILGFAACLAGSTGALADVIDGDWCFEGRHFSIRGPTIVTPEGKKLDGDYSRHSFSYVAPGPDPVAGATIFMLLMNETTLRLRVGRDPATPSQEWRRGDVTS